MFYLRYEDKSWSYYKQKHFTRKSTCEGKETDEDYVPRTFDVTTSSNDYRVNPPLDRHRTYIYIW